MQVVPAVRTVLREEAQTLQDAAEVEAGEARALDEFLEGEDYVDGSGGGWVSGFL